MTRVEYWDTENGKLSADTGLQMLEGVVKWDSFRAAAWNRAFIALWQIQLWDTNEKLALQFSCSSSLLLNQEEDYLLYLHTAYVIGRTCKNEVRQSCVQDILTASIRSMHD